MVTKSGLQWSSRVVFLMATIGSAVGLGNIWRFSYAAGSSGGGAFVVVYLAAALFLALPVLIAELMIGRRGAESPPNAIANVAIESGYGKNWRWMGIFLGGVGAVLALSFYSVVGAWTIAFATKTVLGQLQGLQPEEIVTIIDDLNSKPLILFGWFCLFISLTIYISSKGVKDGLERAVNIMMPALFVMLVLIVFYSAIVGDFNAALNFLFKPDFSKLNAQVVMGAFGQAFFSVSVGLANCIAYGSYLDRTTNIPESATIIVGVDTLVAILAGLAIFPIIFAHGFQPNEGPDLVFKALPIAFGQIPGGLIFGALFFILLFFAALTSSISMMEAPVAWLSDGLKFSRKSAALLSGSVSFCFGTLAVLSFNILSDFYPLDGIALFSGKNFFVLIDYLVTNIIMPLGGMIIALFAGWIVKEKFSRDELFDNQNHLLHRFWLFLVRFVAPAILGVVFFQLVSS